MTFEELTKKHRIRDGQCQKCGQRCDKRVVSFVAIEDGVSTMICPDCKQGKERPFFTAIDKVVQHCSIYTKWTTEQTTQFLQFIPLGITLINHNENTREYWNWDKSKFIKTIETDHEGSILNVQYYTKKEVRNETRRLILKDKQYQIVGEPNMKLAKIHIPEAFQNSTPNPEKLLDKKNRYEKNRDFGEKIVVMREGVSKNKPCTIVDGYTIFLTAQELGLRTMGVIEVELISSHKNAQ